MDGSWSRAFNSFLTTRLQTSTVGSTVGYVTFTVLITDKFFSKRISPYPSKSTLWIATLNFSLFKAKHSLCKHKGDPFFCRKAHFWMKRPVCIWWYSSELKRHSQDVQIVFSENLVSLMREGESNNACPPPWTPCSTNCNLRRGKSSRPQSCAYRALLTQLSLQTWPCVWP